MANSGYNIDELRMDVRDPNVTHVYVYLTATGDSPHFVQGWHHKTYPANLNTLEVHKLLWSSSEHDPLLWERLAPLTGQTSEGASLARAILTWDMGMDPTKPEWAHWEGLRMLAESVIGDRRLIN